VYGARRDGTHECEANRTQIEYVPHREAPHGSPADHRVEACVQEPGVTGDDQPQCRVRETHPQHGRAVYGRGHVSILVGSEVFRKHVGRKWDRRDDEQEEQVGEQNRAIDEPYITAIPRRRIASFGRRSRSRVTIGALLAP